MALCTRPPQGGLPRRFVFFGVGAGRAGQPLQARGGKKGLVGALGPLRSKPFRNHWSGAQLRPRLLVSEVHLHPNAG